MEGESQSIDLLIKTSDQQCPDCNIKCNLDWTIYDLKGHLSTLYPDDLKKDDQKLIYGGKVLADDTVLSSVINTNNDFNYSHVLHLVRKHFKNPSHVFNDNQKNMNTHLLKTPMSDSINSPETLSAPAARQQYLLSLHQMHQAYFQYMHSYQQLYYNQNLFQSSNQNQKLITSQNVRDTANIVEEQRTSDEQPPQQQQELPQPQIINQRNRIQNEIMDNREMDYFEIFCAIIRICIIALLFYSYSSFIRFAIVIFTIVLVRLYKYFRTTNLFNTERHEEQQQEPHNINDNEDEIIDNQIVALSENPSNNWNSPRDILHTVWLFITSFITSLIPDTVEMA